MANPNPEHPWEVEAIALWNTGLSTGMICDKLALSGYMVNPDILDRLRKRHPHHFPPRKAIVRKNERRR